MSAMSFSPPPPRTSKARVVADDATSSATAVEQQHHPSQPPSVVDDVLDTHRQASSLADDYTRLKLQADVLQREKDRAEDVAASLRQELGGATGRLAAAANEHRDQRNQWLREKVELESRNCQVLALHTQLQAKLTKAEKDFERLQTLLEKTVRDANKGGKSVVTVSKPLQRNLSQAAHKAPPQLRDAELAGARAEVEALGYDNAQLRSAVEQLAAAVQRQQREADAAAAAHATEVEALTEALAAAQTQAQAQAATAAEEGGSPRPAPAPAPAATPARIPAAAAEVAALRAQLQRAAAVIREQDVLIHRALIGDLTGLYACPAAPADTHNAAGTDADDANWLSPFVRPPPVAPSSSSSSSTSSARRGGELEMFALPPATPQTLALLQGFGWTNVPAAAAAAAAAVTAAGAASAPRTATASARGGGGGAATLSFLLALSPPGGGHDENTVPAPASISTSPLRTTTAKAQPAQLQPRALTHDLL